MLCYAIQKMMNKLSSAGPASEKMRLEKSYMKQPARGKKLFEANTKQPTISKRTDKFFLFSCM